MNASESSAGALNRWEISR